MSTTPLCVRLDVTRFEPSKVQLKTLRHMEQYLSGARPIRKVPCKQRWAEQPGYEEGLLAFACTYHLVHVAPLLWVHLYT